MNLYFLVEGKRTEKKVYAAWIEHVFPMLQRVDRLEDISADNYFIVAGEGHSRTQKRIIATFENVVAHGHIDHLFICLDSEEMSVSETQQALIQLIQDAPTYQNYSLIVPECCIETWFLGNQKIYRINPQSDKLRTFQTFYNVQTEDPENMPRFAPYQTRAQFHTDYLREMLRERNINYSKNFPRGVVERDYLDALVIRHTETHHLSTFGNLCRLWRKLGGNI